MTADQSSSSLRAEGPLMQLELEDGYSCVGVSFGAEVCAAGEVVFQTGMVGYPESLTDPSYRGQILVCTFPLAGNYGVPSRKDVDGLLQDLPAYFEASQIHVAGLVVASYSGENFSHFLADSSLGTWLKENNVPAIHAVDTRAITKKVREKGSMLARLRLEESHGLSSSSHEHTFADIEWYDPNKTNLVPQISTRSLRTYAPPKSKTLWHPSGRPIRCACLDVGLKYSQLRCLVARGVEVVVLPWDHDFNDSLGSTYDGLFISNGPGDPAMLDKTVDRIAKATEDGKTPIFGICLGHQLLARAAGANTKKMKYGNRGHNIPCTNLLSGKCYITSQNHGYEVDAESLPAGWKPLFTNANDGSNEGIHHVGRPFFSVQFHPESAPGPRDTEFLFDIFVDTVKRAAYSNTVLSQSIEFPGGNAIDNNRMNPRIDVKKALILGSGGLSIGQAGEFDYSGSQAIKALKEEGIYTILVNPNIATIQTSEGLADKVAFVPVNAECVLEVVKREQPDAVYVTFGGQTALQVGIELEKDFEALGVRVLGTPISTINTTEDRELFARSMESIGEKCAKSASANSIEEAMSKVEGIGFPVIVRSAFALGGLGSGFATNEDELLKLCQTAFAGSPQVLIERSMKGWKEIEYEVVRDARDNCITVCNMENFDPLGIHTGDSIVVAPSQTLSDEDYNMLRTTALNVVRHLGVVGECNIQYALNPTSREYCIIEVNARLSRSSALASKATGYPLAFVAAKLGLGIPLDQIQNSVTKKTCACFEPSLDYVVVKIPRWDLRKFQRVNKDLSSSMKSVGEVMAIGRTFEEAIQKGIRSVDYHNLGFNETKALMSIDSELQTPSDQRLFALANAMHAGYTVEKIWEMTQIDRWFLRKLKGLIEFGTRLKQYTKTAPTGIFREAKRLGFSDAQLANFWDTNELNVHLKRRDAGIMPVVKQIDTVAAEFPAYTNYLYLTYNGEENDIAFDDHGIMVLGSGVYRIGSSVEFDWCSVRATRTLRKHGYKTVMVNYNPETVSTDYDEADRLYFECINLETVLDIYELEASSGVIVSVGGQTPNNIAYSLSTSNVKILGTSPQMIHNAENRYNFSRELARIKVDQPEWKNLTTKEEACEFCKDKYPVLIRPSYVLSGAAMNTAWSDKELFAVLDQATEVSRDYPVVITKYIEGAKEIEMDAVAKNGRLTFHFISEHVENAGVHSGDATLILPPQDLDMITVRRIEDATRRIAWAFNISGPLNIQFIAKNNDIKVIECNIRASRSFPFVSKVIGIDLIEMATKAMVGIPFTSYPMTSIDLDYVAVKVPQFSFSRLLGADPVLGVEMASTGEVACFGKDKYEAYLKGLVATGFKLPKKNVLISIGSFEQKQDLLASMRALTGMGYSLFGTPGSQDFLKGHGLEVTYLEFLEKDDEQAREFSLAWFIKTNMIDLFINLPSENKFRRPANYISKGYRTRRLAIDYQVPLVTNTKNAKLLVEALKRHRGFELSDIDFKISRPPQSDEEQIHSDMEDYTVNREHPALSLNGNRKNDINGFYGSADGVLDRTERQETIKLPSKYSSVPYGGTVGPDAEKIATMLPESPRLPSHTMEAIAKSRFRGVSVTSVAQFSKEDLDNIMNITTDMRTAVERYGSIDLLRGQILMTIFWEASTRTSASFDVAMRRLGGQTSCVTASASSTSKGESLADTVRTLACYGDGTVVRHPSDDSADIAARVSPKPIINAGNGSREHPTQALLDLFTIRDHMGTLKTLTVTFLGDLKYGRTVHSLCHLLEHYDTRVQLVSPTELCVPRDVRDRLIARNTLLAESDTLTPEIVAKSDVIYCTRVQRERFSSQSEYARNTLRVDAATLKKAKKEAIIMHPLPRNEELAEDVDTDTRAVYFKQMENGMYTRMALLAMIMYRDGGLP